MQQPDGSFSPIDAEDVGVLRRIFAAGNREVPIFAPGEVLNVRGGHFRVLALDGHLLVLQGISPTEAQAEVVDGLRRKIEEIEGRQ